MLELKLDELIKRISLSLTPSAYRAYQHELRHTTEKSFDYVYKLTCSLLKEYVCKDFCNAYSSFDIDSFFSSIQPVAAIYCSFWGMDYVSRNNHSTPITLNSAFLSEYFNLSKTEAADLYGDRMRRDAQKLIDSINVEDPTYMNPRIMYNYRRSNIMPHIYSGNMIIYLQRSISFEASRFHLRGLTPSITLTAITSTGFLPNGSYLNRNSRNKVVDGKIIEKHNYVHRISGNTINTLEEKFGYQKAQHSLSEKIPNAFFVSNKINYTEVDEKIAEQINLCALDDLLRLPRLNYAMYKYAEALNANPDLSKEASKALAGACSLCINIPVQVSELESLDEDINTLISAIVSGDTDSEIATEEKLLYLTNVIFPYLIELLCCFLFCNPCETDKEQYFYSDEEWNDFLQIFSRSYYIKEYISSTKKETSISLDEQSLDSTKESAIEIANHVLSHISLRLDCNLKSISEIESTVQELNEYYIRNPYTHFTSDYKHILNDANYIYSQNTTKGNNRKNKILTWKNPLNLPLDEVLGIMLDQEYAIARTRLTSDENCSRMMTLNTMATLYQKSQKLYRDIGQYKLIPPIEHIKAVAKAFHEDIWRQS